jgi:hypothetical protein
MADLAPKISPSILTPKLAESGEDICIDIFGGGGGRGGVIG